MKLITVILIFGCTFISGHSTQRPGRDDEPSPFLELASSFLQETLTNQNGGGGGAAALGGIASVIGNLMQTDEQGKSNGAGQIISGIASFIAANANNGKSNGGGGGFDPSIITNVIEMFSNNGANSDSTRQKRNNGQQEGLGLDTIINIASMFLNNNNNDNQQQGSRSARDAPTNNIGEGLMSLLPMVMQTINSFSGPEGDKVHARHKDHEWILPPFLEKIHVMWDHFSNSELAEVLWQKSGANKIFKGFTDREGKLDYERLFDSLQNQSFRRRWIRAATLYLADWVNYVANPIVYQRYFKTGQAMVNGFLQSQGYPKTTFFDPTRPSETISNLVDHVAKRHLNVKIQSGVYVDPAISYVKDLMKLGQARGLLKQLNSTEIADKLTDTVNLEVIEPVLKVYRAYRYITHNPTCDKYILCDINSHDPNENFGLAGVKAGITKFGSMGAAWIVSSKSGTPFWNLFGIINDPYNCRARFPNDCNHYHHGESKVTKEYIHNEL